MEIKSWRFNKGKKQEVNQKKALTVRDALTLLKSHVDPNEERQQISMGYGDPSPFLCFRNATATEDAVVTTLRSGSANGYAAALGIPAARKAVAEYISKDLPYSLSSDDVHLTVGCKQAIAAALSTLAASPNSNILLPRPTFRMYDAIGAYSGLEIRHYDLLPEQGWQVDLSSVEAVTDDKTVAIVVINPGNPTGSVYSRQHLEMVAETAKKLGLLVIADEVYEHITFGSKPFVRMGNFASIVPVLTLGSLSKKWMVPGWRLGWLVTTDPNGFLQQTQFVKGIRYFFSISPEPATFIQAAVPEIIEKTKDEFFSRYIDVIQQDADIISKNVKEIPCITCPSKPEGSMFMMVKLDVSLLDGIQDDVDFCLKLAEQENVIILPGSTIEMENWLRITFALESSILEEGLERVKAFCQRNAKIMQREPSQCDCVHEYNGDYL